MTHINLIICSEWQQRGFAYSIKSNWFNDTCLIVGLRFLHKNFNILSSFLTKHSISSMNLVVFDSIHQPLRSITETIQSLVSTCYTVKCVTHTISPHLDQQIPANETVNFQQEIMKHQSFPVDPFLWEKTRKVRKRQFYNLKPRVFPILSGKGLNKNLSFLKKTSKFPFISTRLFWDAQAIDLISSCGVVGIAADMEEHDLLRRFWNTYGLLVLEDDTVGSLPYPAHGIDFTELLSNKHNLKTSTQSNIEWKHDFELEQTSWNTYMTSIKPTSFVEMKDSVAIDGKLHKTQEESVRYNTIKDAKLIKEGDKVARLPLPTISEDKLPCISVCTLTRNHRLVFPFCVNSLHNQSYPLDKIEWIVLQNGDEPIDDLIPKTLKRKLKRFHIETLPSDHGKTLGELRNIAVKTSTESIVTFMDDDDIYFHTSILARVKAMIKYNVECVGCNRIGTYNLLEEKGGIASDGKHMLSEATLLFKRSFWQERGFNSNEKTAESYGLLSGRQHRCLSVPYHFVILAMTHAVNTTGTLRLIEGKELLPLKTILTEKELSLVESTSKYLKQRYRITYQKDKERRH